MPAPFDFTQGKLAGKMPALQVCEGRGYQGDATSPGNAGMIPAEAVFDEEVVFPGLADQRR